MSMYVSTKSLLLEHRALLLLGTITFAALGSILFRSPFVDSEASLVAIWWTGLFAVSICNIGGWRLSATAVVRRRMDVEPDVYIFQRRQLLLSAVYVFGCGFRSVFPRADVQRLGLFDSWISSVMVGRSVATVAELCFAAQWALLLNCVARDMQSRTGVIISWLLVPLIVVAELCSWYAVLTTCYLGNVIEESIWALSVSLLIFGCLGLWTRYPAGRRKLLTAVLLGAVAYVAFMGMVDIPMYASRWLADEAAGREYLSLGQGLADVWSRRNVTFAWEEWRTEIPWMSLYFSVCVWCSIALVHAPLFRARPRFES